MTDVFAHLRIITLLIRNEKKYAYLMQHGLLTRAKPARRGVNIRLRKFSEFWWDRLWSRNLKMPRCRERCATHLGTGMRSNARLAPLQQKIKTSSQNAALTTTVNLTVVTWLCVWSPPRWHDTSGCRHIANMHRQSGQITDAHCIVRAPAVLSGCVFC